MYPSREELPVLDFRYGDITMNNEMLREALFYDGVEIDIRTVKDDNAEQIKDIRNFIKEGVDLLVVAPNEAAPITPVVEELPEGENHCFDRKILF